MTDDNDRAERINSRVNRSREDTDANDDTDDTDASTTTDTTDASNTMDTTDASDTTDDDSQSAKEKRYNIDTDPVTDRDHITFYLDEDLRAMLRRTRKHIELDLDAEYGVEPEKNRHIRPLMLYLGAQQLQDMDATEITNVLDNTDVLDAIDGTDGADS